MIQLNLYFILVPHSFIDVWYVNYVLVHEAVSHLNYTFEVLYIKHSRKI